MSKPKLLDLYSGAGGAAMGYHHAGFDVTGVDHLPQPRYPFRFVQADALEYVLAHGHEYDAIHASPPCQFYSRLRHLPWLRDRIYWRSIPPTREALEQVGVPWVLENVEDAAWEMPGALVLCGLDFGLHLYRHRLFECWPFLLLGPTHRRHNMVLTPGRASLSRRRQGLNDWNGVAGHQSGVTRHRVTMGIDWMTGAELSQAIPPVYTEFVGTQLLRAVRAQEGG